MGRGSKEGGREAMSNETACQDCGLREQHTNEQCWRIRLLRVRLEEMRWWHERFAAEANYGCCERISQAELALKIAENPGKPEQFEQLRKVHP